MAGNNNGGAVEVRHNAAPPPAQSVVERVIAAGDLAKLSSDERVRYYGEVCQGLGLNPLTQPFAYVTLSGKLVMYCLKGGTDQLRKINGVVVEVVSREIENDCIIVHARAKTPDGRTDEDFGVVSVIGLKGENYANAVMKAITKAKRRVTLSILGLGFLDESELPEGAATHAPAASRQEQQRHEALPAPRPEPAKPQAAPAHPARTPVTPMTHAQHLDGLKRLKGALALSLDEWRSLLADFGVDSATKLDAGQCKALFERLHERELTAALEAKAGMRPAGNGTGGRPAAPAVVIEMPAATPKKEAAQAGQPTFPGDPH